VAVNITGHSGAGTHVQISDGHWHGHGHWYRGHYRQRGNACGGFFCLCVVVALIIVAVVLNPAGRLAALTLNGGEQALLCPSSVWRKGLEVSWNPSSAIVRTYLSSTGVPHYASNHSVVRLEYSSRALFSGDWDSRSFFLAPGSVLTWNVTSTSTWWYNTDFYIIKGESQYNNFVDQKTFNYVHYDSGRLLHGSYTVADYDEYFVVIEAHESIVFREQFYLDRIMYDAATMTQVCTETSSPCTFELTGTPCVVVDVASWYGAYKSVDITVYSQTAPKYWIVVGVVCGAAVLACVAICIAVVCCMCRARTEVNYQQVPPVTIVPAPGYPAGYPPPPPPGYQAGYPPPPPQ